MSRALRFLCLAFSCLCIPAAQASQINPLGHAGISISSAVSITETSAIRFGNLYVASPGDNGASIVLSTNGARMVTNSAATTITLLNGMSSVDAGSQSPGYYHVMGAGAGTSLYVTFTDHAGAAITSGNPIVLTGPVGSSEFNVDSLTFASPDPYTGAYVTADGSGAATILVGATLHTQSGATTYAPGTYRGTFEVVISY